MYRILSLKSTLAALLWPFAVLCDTLGCRLQRLWAFTRLKANLNGLDDSVVVLGTPELHGTRQITMGCNLYLYRDLYLETRSGGAINLGNDVVLSRGVHIVAFAGISVGDGTMIGEYSSLRDANHCFGPGIEMRRAGHRASAIVIGRNVWIGRGVTVLPGVNIGDGAVVGANAVVTRDVIPGAVVAGVPARELRGVAT